MRSRPMFHVYHSTSSLYVEFHSSSRSSELAYGFEASYRYGSRPFCPTDDYEKNGDCSGKGVCDCYTMECICDATHEGVDCTECTTHSQCLEDLYNQALEEYGELTVDFPILAILTVFSLLGWVIAIYVAEYFFSDRQLYVELGDILEDTGK
eukprot:Rmarinus@m.23718